MSKEFVIIMPVAQRWSRQVVSDEENQFEGRMNKLFNRGVLANSKTTGEESGSLMSKGFGEGIYSPL